jgi:hypothetical protein
LTFHRKLKFNVDLVTIFLLYVLAVVVGIMLNISAAVYQAQWAEVALGNLSELSRRNACYIADVLRLSLWAKLYAIFKFCAASLSMGASDEVTVHFISRNAITSTPPITCRRCGELANNQDLPSCIVGPSPEVKEPAASEGGGGLPLRERIAA